MGANNAKVQSLIESVFESAVAKLTADDAGNLISDLYVQADQESGELQIYDDEEHLIEKIVIFDWINNPDDEDAFAHRVANVVKAALAQVVSKKLFDHSRFLKPLSVGLTNEDFVVEEELLFLDDDMLRLDDPLLKDLDEDLDDFLAKLLSDVK